MSLIRDSNDAKECFFKNAKSVKKRLMERRLYGNILFVNHLKRNKSEAKMYKEIKVQRAEIIWNKNDELMESARCRRDDISQSEMAN